MSALGDILTFETFVSGAGLSAFRNRPAGVSQRPVPEVAQNSAVSDDGCVIAYTGPISPNTTAVFRNLIGYDRCTGLSTVLSPIGTSEALLRPALSADGSTIVFVVRTAIAVFSLDQGVAEVRAIVPAPSQGWLVEDVAVSDDGTVFAITSGPEVSDYGFIDYNERNVYVFDVANPTYELASRDASGEPTGRSGAVSISGDGSLVGFDSSGVSHVYDRSVTTARPVQAGTQEPSISNDGRYLTYRVFSGDNSEVFVSRTSDRWQTSSPPELVSYQLPGTPSVFRAARDPVISEHGRWVAWSSPNAESYVVDPALGPNTGDQVLVRERRPVLSVEAIDFGAVPSPLERNAIVRNVGPSGWRVTSIATSGGGFAVASEDCPAVLHPGGSCTVRVRYSPSGEGQETGQLVVRDDSYPGIPLSASARLVGISDPEQPPPDPDPDPEPDPLVSITITPNPVVFDEVVVGMQAPGRTATVQNIGELAVTINASAISGSDSADFAVVSDGCAGTTLQIGSTCDLELEFGATDAGARSATLSVDGSNGGSASARLEGRGRFDVRLEVSPEVASGGQAVMVNGFGFPALEEIGVTLAGSPATVTSDGNGQFSLGWLVLSGLPQGELLADDMAVAGRYDAEPAPLMVVGTPMRPQATATLSRAGRRHVSR